MYICMYIYIYIYIHTYTYSCSHTCSGYSPPVTWAIAEASVTVPKHSFNCSTTCVYIPLSLSLSIYIYIYICCLNDCPLGYDLQSDGLDSFQSHVKPWSASTWSRQICLRNKRPQRRSRETTLHGMFGREEDTVGNPRRAQIVQYEFFELILLLTLDSQFPVEQCEATASQSAVPSPPPLECFSSKYPVVIPSLSDCQKQKPLECSLHLGPTLIYTIFIIISFDIYKTTIESKYENEYYTVITSPARRGHYTPRATLSLLVLALSLIIIISSSSSSSSVSVSVAPGRAPPVGGAAPEGPHDRRRRRLRRTTTTTNNNNYYYYHYY